MMPRRQKEKKANVEHVPFEPTPEEIDQMTATIRRRWSAHMLRKRGSGTRPFQLAPVRFNLRDDLHLADY